MLVGGMGGGGAGRRNRRRKEGGREGGGGRRTRIKRLTLVINQKLMQSLPRRHHRQHRDLLIRNHLQQSRALTIQQPPQTRLHILRRDCPPRLNPHRIRQLDEIRVLLVRVREAVLVEEALPLRHHALLLVVQHDDLDADVELRRGAELRECHVEAGVPVDVNHQGVRAGDFGADGRGEAVSHGAQPAGGDHGAGVAPAEVLRSPHLVLPHASGDDGAVFHVLGHFAESFDDGLGFDEAVGGFFFVVEGELRFPKIDLLEPGWALGLGVDVGEEESDVRGDIAFDGLSRLNNFVDVLGHDFEVHDTASVFGGGGFGLRREFRDAACDAVVEAGSEGDDEIGFLHGHVGVGRAVHTKHMQGFGVQLVEAAEALESGCDGNGGFCR